MLPSSKGRHEGNNQSTSRMLKDTSIHCLGAKCSQEDFLWTTVRSLCSPHSSLSRRRCRKRLHDWWFFCKNSRLSTGTEKWIIGILFVVLVEKMQTISCWLTKKKIKNKTHQRRQWASEGRKWSLSSCQLGWLGRMPWAGPGVEHCPLIHILFSAYTLLTVGKYSTYDCGYFHFLLI